MSTLAAQKRHLAALHDIRDIMAALKNISLTEGMRLRRFLETQQRVIDGIEQAMGDFLGHYRQSQSAEGDFEILLLVGSERGFCGDFNDAVLGEYPKDGGSDRAIVAVGGKLGTKLEEAGLAADVVAGPTTAEDVPDTLLTVVDTLRGLDAGGGGRLTIVYHQYDGHTIVLRRRRPFLDFSPQPASRGYAPRLNLSPQTLYPALLDHYLFAVLHGIFYASLAAEHQLRLQHLQGAIEQIDRRGAALTRHYNSLRQELITEEIELILLSAGPQLRGGEEAAER